ncbi:MAG: mevalonate kinase [Myxococcales bacterium]
MNIRASAPGKVLLLGEHAVVYGHAALAAGLGRGVRIEVTEAAETTIAIGSPKGIPPRPELLGAELLEAASEMAARIGAPPRFRAVIETELPLGAGLGSSAAVGVALARGLSELACRHCPEDRATELALGFERHFHGAPSGVDPAISARGGVILFRRGEPPRVARVRPRAPVFLCVALTGIARGTRSTVMPLSERRAARPSLYDPMLAFLGDLAQGGALALERGDLDDLGVRFDAAHGVLCALGVSCPELDDLVRLLRKASALGAKLTGAGGGGAAIGLARDREHAQALSAAVAARNLESFVAEIAA